MAVERPHPPGAYRVVVGSGPGGLQTAYSLGRLGVRAALPSADPSPGGTFLRWPYLQRLITWTKPFSEHARDFRWSERYDWNSLLANDPAHRGTAAETMDGTSYFPSRAEMERGIASWVGKTGTAARYGCHWLATRRDRDGYVLETSDGEYRAPVVVIATGMTEPYQAPIPGLELASHYAAVKPLDAYRGKRVFIVGKRNSGFELADGLLPHARRLILASPRSAIFATETHTIAGVRARYVQPLEDHILRGGVLVLDASVERVGRTGDAYRVTTRPSAGGDAMDFDMDEVIAATGFRTTLNDLPALGLRTHGHLQVPAHTPYFESATLPGVFFAGSVT